MIQLQAVARNLLFAFLTNLKELLDNTSFKIIVDLAYLVTTVLIHLIG